MNEKIKEAIHKFIERNKDQISLVRVVSGNTTKADTIALYSIDEAYMPNGDHAVVTIDLLDIPFAICDVLDENGFGSIFSYMRLYAYKESGKQFATMQKTCNLDQPKENPETQQIAPIVSPLINGMIKLVDQMMKANETLSNSLAHSQDAQLRLMDGILEAKEEGIDYQALALQTQMILENMQQPTDDNDNDMGERLLSVLSMGMGGMGMPQPQPHAENDSDIPDTPTKEQMKNWAKQDPNFINRTFEAYKEFQSENNTTKTTSQGENNNE